MVITSWWIQISNHHIHTVSLDTILSILHTITFANLTFLRLRVWGRRTGATENSANETHSMAFHTQVSLRPFTVPMAERSPWPAAGQHGQWQGHVETHMARLSQSCSCLFPREASHQRMKLKQRVCLITFLQLIHISIFAYFSLSFPTVPPTFLKRFYLF